MLRLRRVAEATEWIMPFRRFCDMRGKTGAGKVGEPAPDCPKGIGRLRSFRQQENHANREGAVVAVCSIIDFETQSLRIVGRHYNL